MYVWYDSVWYSVIIIILNTIIPYPYQSSTQIPADKTNDKSHPPDKGYGTCTNVLTYNIK